MSISTGRGDDGTTSLAGGGRTSKSDPRVEAFGALDEAGAAVGAARALVTDEMLADVLRFAQHRLLNCSARIATPPQARGDATPRVDADDAVALERATGRFMDAAGDLPGFVTGAETRLSAQLHVARTVVRRAERRVVALGDAQDADVVRFLNRLSDALFAAARYARALEGAPEERWDPGAPPPEL